MSDALTVKRFKGKEILSFIPELAELRIKIFRDYPYLYEGDLKYEKNYLQTYINCSESIMILVFNQSKIVGVSTAIPLSFESENWHTPFLNTPYAIEDIFYLGESLLLPEYRGQGIYRQFFNEREAAAMAYGSKITGFIAVDRPENHPKKPHNYIPLDRIWQHFGYQKHPELCMQLGWKEIDEAESSLKPLTYWLKNL